MHFSIPEEIRGIAANLRKSGFQSYLVGGCVRDLLIGREPKDWDITTNATPEQIQVLFPSSFYENNYGTVGVKTDSDSEQTAIVEVTPYRKESDYSDKRRPDTIIFSSSLSEDLERRDFTINAIAVDDYKGQIIDPYRGQEDIKDKIIRTVGDPKKRFNEDALRMLRAIRFVAEIDFGIDGDTAKEIEDNSKHLNIISRERIRDEFKRIIISDQPMHALLLAQHLCLLKYIIPELSNAVGIEQNQAHKYDVFEHMLRSVQHAADKKWDLEIRLSALLHDIGKPETRRYSEEKNDWTFYGHEVVGSRVTRKILENLHFSREIIEKVTKLVRWHMFFSDPDKITLSAVRRMIRNVGKENIFDLLNLRICDRVGTGRPKEQPFRFRKYKAMVDEALRDPISVSMLNFDGTRIMNIFHEKPGPRIGYVLNILLEEILDDPKKNTEIHLEKRSGELLKLENVELQKLGEGGKRRKEQEEKKEIEKIFEKHKVSRDS